MLGNVQDGVEHLQIGHADIASLQLQAMLELGKMFGRDLHARWFIRLRYSR